MPNVNNKNRSVYHKIMAMIWMKTLTGNGLLSKEVNVNMELMGNTTDRKIEWIVDVY